LYHLRERFVVFSLFLFFLFLSSPSSPPHLSLNVVVIRDHVILGDGDFEREWRVVVAVKGVGILFSRVIIPLRLYTQFNSFSPPFFTLFCGTHESEEVWKERKEHDFILFANTIEWTRIEKQAEVDSFAC
jgi:hypothetical protein